MNHSQMFKIQNHEKTKTYHLHYAQRIVHGNMELQRPR